MSVIRRVTKNTSLLFISQIVSYILGFFYLMYAARYLGPESYGIITFALAFTLIFGILSDLGLSQYTVRELSKDKSLANKYISNAIAIKIITSIITFFIIIITINLINYSQTTINVVYFIALYVLFNSFTQLFYSVFQSYEKMEYQAIGIILNNLLLLTMGLLAIYYQMDVIFFAILYFLTSLIILIYAVTICIWKFIFPKIEFNLNFWKLILSESIFFVLAMIFTEIYFNIDSVMLSFMVNNEAVGFYNASYRLIFVLLFIPSVLIISMFPIMSKHFKSAKNLLKIEYEKIFKYLFIISLLILVLGFLFADKIILTIYGNTFIPSIKALQILVCVIPVIFITYLFGNLLGAINKQRIVAIITGVSAILNILLNIILIPKFSYLGASLATVLTEICVFMLMFIYISRFFHTISIKNYILKPLIGASILAISIYFIIPINWMLALILGLIFYIPILCLLKIINKEDFMLITKLLQKDR